jgi:hypothetical protein
MSNTLGQCIEWTNIKDKDGYGFFVRKRKRIRAHRDAYCRHHNVTIESIAKFHVLHKCDNRACVNPLHLELGTHTKNMNDMAARNRAAKPTGEKNGRAKMTDEQVLAMRSEYVPRSKTNGLKALTKKYGISRAMASRIVRRIYWVHI